MSAAIRRLGSHDALSFKAIRLEALKANPELLRSTFELEDKLDVAWFAGRLQNPNVMGAFCDGELVGTAGFSIQEGAPNAYKGRLFGMYKSAVHFLSTRLGRQSGAPLGLRVRAICGLVRKLVVALFQRPAMPFRLAIPRSTKFAASSVDIS